MTSQTPTARELMRVRWPLQRAVLGTDLGGWRAVGTGDGLELSTVREYDIGDDPRRLNWTATARTGHLQVNVPVAERALRTVLAVDASGSMSTGSIRTKFAVACEAAETIVRIATRYSDRIDIAFTGAVPSRSHARQGKKALIAAQQLITTVSPDGRGGFGNHLISTLRARPGLVIAVSDWRDQADLDALRRCVEITETIVVRVNDPAEQVLPDVGFVTVEDPETGRQILLDTSDNKFQEQFRMLSTDLDDRFRAVSRHAALTLELFTDGDHGGRQVVTQLLQSRRGRR